MHRKKFMLLLCLAGSLLGSGCMSTPATDLKPEKDPLLKRTAGPDTGAFPAGGAVPVIIPKVQVHSAKKGETLSSIASSYGISCEKLAEYNNLSNPQRLKVGQKLQIPDSFGAAAQISPAAAPVAPPLPTETAAPF